MKQIFLRFGLTLQVAALLFLPIQIRVCQAAEMTDDAGVEESVQQSAEAPTEQTTEAAGPAEESTTSGMSTSMMIGIGAGVAVLAGVAIAAGSSGGGDDNESYSAPAAVPEPETPPTSDQLVSYWNANASQTGSGLTYSGYYQLYQGGGLSYNLWVSDGEHFVGGGGWSLNGYTLTMHTDHGSTYVGTVYSGKNITSIGLNANNGWSLTLSR